MWFLYEIKSSWFYHKVGDGIALYTPACLIAEYTSIMVERNTLIGTKVCIFDLDFHDLLADQGIAVTNRAKLEYI